MEFKTLPSAGGLFDQTGVDVIRMKQIIEVQAEHDRLKQHVDDLRDKHRHGDTSD